MSTLAPSGRRVALVLVLVVVGAGVVGAAGPVAAQTDGGNGNGDGDGGQDITVDTARDGGTLVVSVSESAFDSTPENASIDVSFTDYSRNKTIDEAQNTSEFYEFETSVTELVGDADVTEPRPTVNVSYPGGNQSVRVDVRLLRLAALNASSVEVTATGAYTFPVDRAVGINDSDRVQMRVSGSDTTANVTATFECGDSCGTGAVAFDPGEFQDTVSPLDKQTYEFYPETNFTETKDFDLKTVGGPTFTVAGDALAVQHPLLFDNTTYDVRAELETTATQTSRPSARERDGLGVVALPSNLTGESGLQVTVTHNESGDEVFAQVSPDATTFAPDATAVPYDNETSAFDLSAVGPELNGSDETVWLAHNLSEEEEEEIRRVENASVNDSLLKGVKITKPGEYRFLIAGGDTVVGVNASVSAAEIRPPPDDGGLLPEGLSTVVLHGSALTLLGLVAVVVSGLTGEFARTTSLGEAALLVGILAFLAAFGVLWVLGAGSYGMHAFAALILVGVGWTAGTRQTFNDGTTESLLANVIIASIGLFAGVVVALLALTGPTLVDYATVLGGVIGATLGFVVSSEFTPKHRVTIELVDEETREVVGTDEYINVTRADGTDRREVKASGGKTALTLPEGGWKFSSGSDAIDLVTSEDIRRDRTIRLPIARPGARIRLRGMTAEETVSNATVTIEPADGPGDETELRESRNNPGTYGGDLPPDVSKARVAVSHDDYQPVEQTYRIVDNRLGEEIDLAPKLGSMEIRVALHGDPIPDVPVEIEARTDLAKEPHRHEETNDRGRVVLSGIAIGEYDVGIDLPTTSDEFEIEPVDNPVTVRADETTTERIDVRFTYELPPDARREVREIRDRLESIASHPRSDVAIPTFYASVVHELLDTVEDVPDQSRAFLEAGRSPAATVEALLGAAEAGAEAIDEAMSSKQNVDLFAACGDMEPVDAEWSGRLDLEKLFTLADEDAGKRRARLAERLDEVDETISAELRDLSEVRPAQDMWEQTRDVARETADEEVDAAAVGLLAAGLLDAIEALFDRDPLRERMTRTVF